MRMNQEVLNKEEGVLFWHEFKIKASIPNTIQPEDKQSRIKQTLLTFNQTQAQALAISNPMLDDLSVWELLKHPNAPYQLHLIQWGGCLTQLYVGDEVSRRFGVRVSSDSCGELFYQ